MRAAMRRFDRNGRTAQRNMLLLFILMLGFPLASLPASAVWQPASVVAHIGSPSVTTNPSTAQAQFNASSLPCLINCPTVPQEGSNAATESALNKLIASQYGVPCATPSTPDLCSISFPVTSCTLTGSLCTTNLTSTPSNIETMTDDLVHDGIASGSIWFNNTVNIDEAGTCRACGGYDLSIPTFDGRQGIVTAVYGGYGPQSNPDTYFNISQSATLVYTPQTAVGGGSGPNVITGVSFYAEALDGSNAVMQVSTYCSGFGNTITGSSGEYTTYIPVNPGAALTVTNASLIAGLPGQVSIHFTHYLWCGDVNQSAPASYTVEITVLPYTINGAIVGGGSNGVVSWTRVELGQSNSNTLGVNQQLPKGDIPEVALPTNPPGQETNLNFYGGPYSMGFTVSGLTNSGVTSAYSSNYGFTFSANGLIEDTSTSSGSCPPTGLSGVNNNGGCGVNYWNGFEYADFFWPAIANGVECGESVNTAVGSTWTTLPSSMTSSSSLQMYATPAYSYGGGVSTCHVNTISGSPPGFTPSVTANAYLADTNIPVKAFMVPTTLYGYMGTRATVDGGIALPSYVHLTAKQLANLAASSYVNISWWESWQNPLLQLLCPQQTCTNGAQGQPLFWLANISVGNTTAEAFNNLNGYTDHNMAGDVAPLENESGCPGTAAFGIGTYNGYQAVANPNIPINTGLVDQYAFSGEFNNLSTPICQPTLYWNYTPPMPMPIGYAFFSSNESLLSGNVYQQGQTVWADDYIFNVHVPGFMVRESYGVPGVAGIELPYPYTDFLSLYQNASLVQGENSTIATWWWKTTAQADSNCPYAQTSGWITPVSGNYQLQGGATQGRIDNACEQTSTVVSASLAGGTTGIFQSVDGMVSMTPIYGTTIKKTSGSVCNGTGQDPCDEVQNGNPISPILNSYSIPNATAFTAHIPAEQVGGAINGGIVQGGVYVTGQGWTYNLSGTYASASYPEIQEFEVLLAPQYGALNLNSVASASCVNGGLLNLTFPVGGLACAGTHATETTYPMTSPQWGPHLTPPLNLSLSLQQASVHGYPITGDAGLGSNFVSPGPWYVRTSLNDDPYTYGAGGENAAALNAACGWNVSSYWAGGNINLEPYALSPPPQGSSDISAPYWWSNTSWMTPPCDGYQTYDAYSVNLVAGLLPYGNYSFNASATGFNPASMDATIATPEINNGSLMLCNLANTTVNNSGCDTKDYHVSMFSFSVHNISGPFNHYLSGSFITVAINGSGMPTLTIGMNDTGCAHPLSGFCNNTLILMTPKAWSGMVTLTDVMGSALSSAFKPYGNESVNVAITAIAQNNRTTTSYSESYDWNPIYSQCSLSGSCGCLVNCGSVGPLAWLEQNLLNIIITIIAALAVTGLVYYLHNKGDDQMAGLVASGGGFLVAAIGWLSLVANWNTSDSVFLALLITGAGILAPGIGLLLTMRTQTDKTVTKTTATFQTVIHRVHQKRKTRAK